MDEATYDRVVEAMLGGDNVAVREALEGTSLTPPRAGLTTPLYLAAVQGEAEIVQLLIEAGADPNEISRGDNSEGAPLCAATSHGLSDTVRVLLDAGADPDLRDPDLPDLEGLTA